MALTIQPHYLWCQEKKKYFDKLYFEIKKKNKKK